MKTRIQFASALRRGVAVLLAAALAIVAIPPIPAAAQDAYGGALGRLLSGTPVLTGLGADDTSPAIVIRYVGDNSTGGTLTVESDGNLTFKQGPVGSSAADDTLECPVSGGLGGIIDVSDSACDTFGEVLDVINASTDWRAALVGAIRSDSSNDTLNALSEAQANSLNGVQAFFDTNVAFKSAVVVGDPSFGYASKYLQGRSTLKSNPHQGESPILFLTNATSTYGSGTSNFNIVCVTVTAASSGSEVVTTYATPAGATTVNAILDFSPYGIRCPTGTKMISRLVNSAAAASVVHYVAGVVTNTP